MDQSSSNRIYFSLNLLLCGSVLSHCAAPDSAEQLASQQVEQQLVTPLRLFGQKADTGNPQNYWTDTSVNIAAGGALSIRCSAGLISPWAGHAGFGCNGEPGNLWNQALVPTCAFGSLVGKIGLSGTPFCVGANSTLNAPAAGRLYLAFNDGVTFADNFGTWDVLVESGFSDVLVEGLRSNVGAPQSWWNDSRVDVTANASLDFACLSGSVKPWPGHAGFGCGGDPNTRWDQALAPGCAFGSLIGKVGSDGAPFCLNASASIRAPRAGRLFLAFNDGVSFADNTGNWKVRVSQAATPTGCITPVSGLVITANTQLCPGSYALAVGPGNAALTVRGSNLTVACTGVVLRGTSGVGSTASPTVGIRVENGSNVTLDGCTASNFRYGLSAQGTSNLTIRNAHFDDNFTDPNEGWVYDNVQGGGLRLERVTTATVQDTSAARNWNGIELRGSSGVTVTRVTADHCSNTGALLLAAHNNTLINNNFSWGIRGTGLNYPATWYGVDTRDSAGILLDAGSSGNRIESNNTEYGGDGIFLRAIVGFCPEHNRIINNATSYSPHNAIEGWCDFNEYIGNTASRSNFGIWLGGTDYGVVTGNRVENNRVDGISIQIAEDRHTLIADNQINNNGRIGLLLSGREYQEGVPLSFWSANVANSSHIIVQRNAFANNSQYDIFSTSTSGLALLSNCTSAAKVNLGRETRASYTAGTCNGATGRTPPTATLTGPTVLNPNQSATFVATGSPAGALSFNWLVQPAGPRFAGGSLPPLIFGGPGTASQSFVFTQPGYYDVDVTVADGALAGFANRALAVLPVGTAFGTLANQWGFSCASQAGCVTSFVDEANGIQGSAVHVTTDAAFDFSAITPAARNLGLNAGAYTKLGVFFKARNLQAWQGNFPVIVLGSGTTTRTYTPAANLLPNTPEWAYIELPLNPAAGSGWSVQGPALSRIDYVEFHADTWGAGFELWFDGLTLY